MKIAIGSFISDITKLENDGTEKLVTIGIMSAGVCFITVVLVLAHIINKLLRLVKPQVNYAEKQKVYVMRREHHNTYNS